MYSEIIISGIKIIVAIILVLNLIYISEKSSPKVAGIVGGTAIGGTSIAIFFFAFEHGIPFATQAIPFTIAGLACEIIFYIGYYLGGIIFPSYFNRYLHIFLSLFFSLSFFLVFGDIITSFDISLLVAIFIFLLGLIFGLIAVKNIRYTNSKTDTHATKGEMIFRILLTATIIFLVTNTPHLLSNKWSGIFAAFPTTTLPVLLILQYKYGEKIMPLFVKNISWSISTLVVYLILVYYMYPMHGIYIGTIAAFFFSTIYLLLVILFLTSINENTKFIKDN